MLHKFRKLSVFNNETFTSLEITIALAIMSIIMLVGIPSISALISSNQAANQSHDFIDGIQLGLNESVKQKKHITLCAKKPAINECINTENAIIENAWQYGWLLFTDTNNSGIYDATHDILLKSQINNSQKVNITAEAYTITFNSQGHVIRGDGNYYFSPSKCISNTGHQIILTKDGDVLARGGVCQA